jgi:hypothetical protein
MEHKWGERKTIILFAKDERIYVHDSWKRNERQEPMEKRLFLNRQRRKFG